MHTCSRWSIEASFLGEFKSSVITPLLRWAIEAAAQLDWPVRGQRVRPVHPDSPGINKQSEPSLIIASPRLSQRI